MSTTARTEGCGALVLLALVALASRGGGPQRVGNALAPARISERFEVHGHRGARGLAPENTLPGFERALDLGVDALEADLRLTADGAVVIAHDPFVSRALCSLDAHAAGPPAPDPARSPEEAPALRIEALTSAQLARYRCDRNPSARRFPAQRAQGATVAGADFRIPSLEALFAFVEAYATDPRKPIGLRARARHVRFNLETKRDGSTARAPSLERALVDAITRHGLARRVLVQSFDAGSLAAVHRLAPALPLAYLTSSPFAGPEDAAAAGAGTWSPDFRFLTAAEVREAHALGVRVLPYTVDAMDDLRGVLHLGVDGIISDRPDRLLALVGRRAEVDARHGSGR
jgi:glycerophosphoryl diester phosphodiesterase